MPDLFLNKEFKSRLFFFSWNENAKKIKRRFVTVQRQCCACSAAWRRWGRWASAPCSLAKAAWPPGGRARRGETTRAAPCTPPASRGPPPSPRPHHLGRRGGSPDTKNMKSACDEGVGRKRQSFWSQLTSAFEDITAPAFQPGHVFETQKGGVHSEARATLPDPVDVTGTHLWHQGH